MSVKRVGVEATYTPDATVSGNPGSYTKAIANMIVEMSDGMLEFYSSTYDTATRYTGFYLIKGSNAGIIIYNNKNESKMAIAPARKLEDGTIKGFSSYSTMSFSTTAVLNITFGSIGNFFCEVSISYGNDVRRCWIGWGTCSAFGDAMIPFGNGLYAEAFTDNASGQVYQLLDGSNSQLGYFAENGSHSRRYEMLTNGKSYALSCHSNYWYPSSGTAGYSGYIKWGGLYDMYVLYDTSNPVSTIPCRKYILDGVEYVSTGNYLLIPVITGTNTIA